MDGKKAGVRCPALDTIVQALEKEDVSGLDMKHPCMALAALALQVQQQNAGRIPQDDARFWIKPASIWHSRRSPIEIEYE
jgi:hypothetical protein